MALNTATRGYVLELGTIVLSGPSKILKSEQGLETAHLGSN